MQSMASAESPKHFSENEIRVTELFKQIEGFAYFIERLQDQGLYVRGYDGETISKFADRARIFKMVDANKFSMLLENKNRLFLLILEKVFANDKAGTYEDIQLRIGINIKYPYSRYDPSKIDVESCSSLLTMKEVSCISIPPLVVAGPSMLFWNTSENMIGIDLKRGIYSHSLPG